MASLRQLRQKRDYIHLKHDGSVDNRISVATPSLSPPLPRALTSTSGSTKVSKRVGPTVSTVSTNKTQTPSYAAVAAAVAHGSRAAATAVLHAQSIDRPVQTPQPTQPDQHTEQFRLYGYHNDRKGLSEQAYIDRLRTIAVLSSATELQQHLHDEKLSQRARSDLLLFKANASPCWEHEDNAKGGQWIMTFNNPKKACSVFQTLSNAMLAQTPNPFNKAPGIFETIIGVVLAVRPWGSRISIWSVNSEQNHLVTRMKEKLRRMLKLKRTYTILYKSHRQSAIENTQLQSPTRDSKINNRSSFQAEEVSDSDEDRDNMTTENKHADADDATSEDDCESIGASSSDEDVCDHDDFSVPSPAMSDGEMMMDGVVLPEFQLDTPPRAAANSPVEICQPPNQAEAAESVAATRVMFIMALLVALLVAGLVVSN